MMQTTNLQSILASIEKHCPVSQIDTGLQGRCNDMRLELVTKDTKKDVFRNKLISKKNEWRAVS